MIGIIVAGGIMSAISAYMLFKVGNKKDDFNMASALQALFFFIIIANFIVMGSAAYDSRMDCEYLLTQENTTYKYGNNFSDYHWDYSAGTAPDGPQLDAYIFHTYKDNYYEYTCNERLSNSASWIYRIPIWVGYISVLYLIIFFLMLIYDLYKKYIDNKGRGE